jgi:hypothetical protein
MSFITSPGVIVPPLTAGGVAYGTGGQAKVNSAGTAGQVLTSAGAGVPVWATPVTPAGGSMIFLSTVTAVNAATVDIETTFSSTYNTYVIFGTNIRTTIEAGIFVRMKIGGSYITSGTYNFLNQYMLSSGTVYDARASQTATEIRILETMGTGAARNGNFALYVWNPASTTARKSINWFGGSILDSNTRQFNNGTAHNTGTDALTGIRIYNNQAFETISGVFSLYGIVQT